MLCALLLVLTTSRVAAGQIVNIQPLVAKDDRVGLSGAMEASADWRSGNTDLLLLSGSLVGRYRQSRHLVFLLARGEYGVEKGDRFVSTDLEHLRYRVGITPPLELEVFAQHDRDEFRRLALRTLGGAGPRLHFLNWAAMDAALGAAYLVEYEELRAGDESDAGETQLNHRISSYLTLAIRLNDWLRLGHTFYVQPRVDGFEDVRVLSETEFLITVTKHFSFKLALSTALDSQPPVGVQAVDAKRKGSIQLTF